MAIKKQDLSIDTNFEQFCENWIDPITVQEVFEKKFQTPSITVVIIG